MLRLTRRIREGLATEETKLRELKEAEDATESTESALNALLDLPPHYPRVARSRHEAAAAEVDQLTDELAILALDLRDRVHRQAVSVCVDALHERADLPPPPARIGRRATWVIEKMIDVSLNRRAWWRTKGLVDQVRNDLNYLSSEVTEVKELRAERFRDQKRADEKWAREQRERRESDALDSEGDGTS